MRWEGHTAHMGEGESCRGILYGNLRKRDQWGDPGVDRKIISGWIFRKWNVVVWTGLG
jgi:hypothetical protein